MEGDRGVSAEGEEKVLTLLSMNSRTGIDKISAETGIKRGQVYTLIKKLIKKYGIRFVPEIGLDCVWKYEFLGQSWGKSKKELLQTNMKKLGFEQYIAFIQFKGQEKPTHEEILKATEGSYIPQYIARTTGGCSLFMYLVARNSLEVSAFTYTFLKNLSKFSMELRLKFIQPTFGYFPLCDGLIQQMQIQARYQKLLLALNKNARVKFTALLNDFGGVSDMTMSELGSRLRETGLLRRSTICITRPREQLTKLFVFSIVDMQKFQKNRYAWFLELVKSRFRDYVFMADIEDPFGIMIITKFETVLEAEEFKEEIDKLDMGVKLEESTILESVRGELGIRNFMPEETPQYNALKAKGLIKSGIRKGKNFAKKNSSALKTKSRKAERIDFAALEE